jgi:FkbM family methyltransferase
MKRIARQLARSFGLEITRYQCSKSTAAQLAKVLELCSIDVVFDVGANKGQFANGIREHGYTGTIRSFEPLTSAREMLLELSARDPLWHVNEQCAIGDRDGEIEIYIAGNSVSSSVLPMLQSHSQAAAGSVFVASENVPIRRLDSITNRCLAPENNLFIKIDTQGYEWQVLDGAIETLRLARGLLCELSLVPLYDGQRLWRDILDRLSAEGFMLWALQKGFSDPRTGQQLQMDGIFLRRDVLKR